MWCPGSDVVLDCIDLIVSIPDLCLLTYFFFTLETFLWCLGKISMVVYEKLSFTQKFTLNTSCLGELKACFNCSIVYCASIYIPHVWYWNCYWKSVK